MHHISVGVVVLIVALSTTVAVSNLPLNPHAPFIFDVQTIEHKVESREININLHPTRRCLHPTFMVRLSGVSLYLLDLVKVEKHKKIYSYPPLLDAGVYFVEVVALLCAPFNPDNFISACLESVANGNNIVTLPYSFLVGVNETVLSKATAQRRPRWVLTDKQNATILSTRYQKLGCMSAKGYACHAKAVDCLQHGLFNWTDGPDYLKPLQEVIAMSRKEKSQLTTISNNNNTIRVCLVGDSHSRMIADQGNMLEVKDVRFVHIVSHFPEEFDISCLQKHNCSYAIVTYGQWPASFQTKGSPYNRTSYTQGTHRVISLLQNYDHNQTQVFVRSENYNGLGGAYTECPAIEFRTPPVIDMYNAVLRKLCKELNVEFIDLNHIIGPLWDSAEDWSHPYGKVATAETEWILWRMLRSSLQRQHRVVLYAE